MDRKPLILVVDDDPELRRMVQHALEFENYTTAGAEDGRTALDAIKALEPDLVILDAMMPDISGFQVLEKMRTGSDVPVIMLTALAEAESVFRALMLGADDYVRKPFYIRELVERVKIKLWRATRK